MIQTIPLPRFLVCVGPLDRATMGFADFVAVDVPILPGATVRGALMFSTGEKAREFINRNPGKWHVRCLEFPALLKLLSDPHLIGVRPECVLVDYLNDETMRSTTVIDISDIQAAEWNEETAEPPVVPASLVVM